MRASGRSSPRSGACAARRPLRARGDHRHVRARARHRRLGNSTANLGDDVIYSGTWPQPWKGTSGPARDRDNGNGQPRRPLLRDAARRRWSRRAPQGRPAARRHYPQRQRARSALEHIAGFEVTPGNRHRAEPCTRQEDPRGRSGGGSCRGPRMDAGPGTDFHAVRYGRISITPIDLTATRRSNGSPAGSAAADELKGAVVMTRACACSPGDRRGNDLAARATA